MRAWLELDEETFAATFYCASVTRCYPGRVSGRGDRTPSPAERRLCAPWRVEELRLLRPSLILTVGGLAAAAIVGARTLTECVGKSYVIDDAIVIPLPHPSGASAWLNEATNRRRLGKALTHARREVARLDDLPLTVAAPCATMPLDDHQADTRPAVSPLDPEIEQRIDGPVSSEAVRETRMTPAEAIEGMRIRFPERGNRKLRRVIDRANADPQLKAWWHVSNVNAVARMQINDHSWVHIQVVVNIALKLLRQLTKHGIEPSAVRDYGMTNEDSEVIVVLSALMHCVGMSVHRRGHEDFSLFLSEPKMRELLDGIYDEPERTVIISEVLQAITSHRSDGEPLALEAGILRVADALDMAKGRSRIPFEAGSVSMHSLSAAAIEEVTIEDGDERPVKIGILMNNSSGLFQVDGLLKAKLRGSGLEPYVEVIAHIDTENEKRLVSVYRLDL